MAMNAGSRDNRPVERRLDVLVFSSDPLGEPVEILGDVAAESSSPATTRTPTCSCGCATWTRAAGR